MQTVLRPKVKTQKRTNVKEKIKKYKFMLKIAIVCFIWTNAMYETAPAVDIASEEVFEYYNINHSNTYFRRRRSSVLNFSRKPEFFYVRHRPCTAVTYTHGHRDWNCVRSRTSAVNRGWWGPLENRKTSVRLYNNFKYLYENKTKILGIHVYREGL